MLSSTFWMSGNFAIPQGSCLVLLCLDTQCQTLLRPPTWGDLPDGLQRRLDKVGLEYLAKSSLTLAQRFPTECLSPTTGSRIILPLWIGLA